MVLDAQPLALLLRYLQGVAFAQLPLNWRPGVGLVTHVHAIVFDADKLSGLGQRGRQAADQQGQTESSKGWKREGVTTSNAMH